MPELTNIADILPSRAAELGEAIAIRCPGCKGRDGFARYDQTITYRALDARVEALRLADAFRAKVIDATVGHFIFEITGKPSKIDQFIAIMKPMGLIEVCRTGIAALNRGPQGM